MNAEECIPACTHVSHGAHVESRLVPAMPCSRAPSEHRPKTAIRAFPFNACIARSVTKAEIAREPAAQKTMQVEWDRLRHKGVWDESKVREWDDVAAEARAVGNGVRANLGYLFGICVEKNSEQPKRSPITQAQGTRRVPREPGLRPRLEASRLRGPRQLPCHNGCISRSRLLRMRSWSLRSTSGRRPSACAGGPQRHALLDLLAA